MDSLSCISLIVLNLAENKILFSEPTSSDSKDDMVSEFPPSLYTDFISLPISTNDQELEARLELAKKFVETSLASNGPKQSVNLSTLTELGVSSTPNWGCCAITTRFYILSTIESKDHPNLSGYQWMPPIQVLSNWLEGVIRIPSTTLGILRNIQYDLEAQNHINYYLSLRQNLHLSNDSTIASHLTRFWHANTQEKSTGLGTKLRLEFAPGIECIPMSSNTIYPFHSTNLTIVYDQGNVLIVDPGANDMGKPHLEGVLQRLNPESLQVFLTHHHHDHVESLDVIERLYPTATLLGHPYTLARVHGCKLKPVPLCADDKDISISVGLRELIVLSVPGHTKGHLCLFDSKYGVLAAGDHVVGFGSSVLDPDGGACMQDYLDSTKRLLELEVNVILPCHGKPILVNARSLLDQYVSHRLEREKSILDAWNQGEHSIDGLTKIVYANVPSRLFAAAKRNVVLHLEKLNDDSTISLSEDILSEIEMHHYRSDLLDNDSNRNLL